MFQTLGAQRTSQQDRQLAGYLALIAGTVNSVGFVILGSFTSHVTGNVGRLADETARGHASTAAVAGAAVVAFFIGALGASLLIESRALGAMSRTSAALLFIEASLVGAFVAGASGASRAFASAELQAMCLSGAMGLQNSLVTRLSGAVVRTTHITGVVTDLGIEAARWFRYGRSRGPHRLTITSTKTPRPPIAKVALLLTIFGAFVIGSISGSLVALRFGSAALLPVLILLLGGAVYALA